jgi:hydroxypyruvate reductase
VNPIYLEAFKTESLRSTNLVEPIAKITQAAITAVDPTEAVKQVLQLEGTRLIIADKQYNLSDLHEVFLVGVGKACVPMGLAVVEIINEHLSEGILITKEGHLFTDKDQFPSKLAIFEASHPLPDKRSVNATHKIINLLNRTQGDDLVICLISGGGSALLTAPTADMSLNDLRTLTSILLASGATINEINCLRKHLSLIKGGNLAGHATPAFLSTLILSDVVGDPLDVIASGPTVPDRSTYRDALQVLNKYRIYDEIPSKIINHLQRGLAGEIPETPKPHHQAFNKTQNYIIGNNYLAAQAAIYQAQAEGYNTLLLTTFLQGEAREAGQFISSLARQIAKTDQPVPRPACVVIGGETTVTIRGEGSGGRNQELALSTVGNLSTIPNITLVTFATDGGDGPTDAAGAVVTNASLNRAASLGLDPDKYLDKNDSYNFFESLGDLIKTGPTQTNVNDLIFLFLH